MRLHKAYKLGYLKAQEKVRGPNCRFDKSQGTESVLNLSRQDKSMIDYYLNSVYLRFQKIVTTLTYMMTTVNFTCLPWVRENSIILVPFA